MEIEKLKMEHVEQVISLQRELVDFALTDAQARERYREMMIRDDYFLAVAREGDEILGTATGIVCRALSMPFLVVEDVIVKTACRSMGIGGKLLAELDKFAMANRCQYAILVSSGFRQDAHRFYEKQGYTEDVRGFRKGYEYTD